MDCRYQFHAVHYHFLMLLVELKDPITRNVNRVFVHQLQELTFTTQLTKTNVDKNFVFLLAVFKEQCIPSCTDFGKPLNVHKS